MAIATLHGHTVAGFISREKADAKRTGPPIDWKPEHVGLTQTTCCNKVMGITQQEYEACLTMWRWGTETLEK